MDLAKYRSKNNCYIENKYVVQAEMLKCFASLLPYLEKSFLE